MVNDDKAFLRLTSNDIVAYGSPWSGKHGLGSNISLPLNGICFLQRGAENRISRATPEQCLAELRHQCFIPEDENAQKKAFALVDTLAKSIHLWEMECTKDISAALTSYQAMSGIL